MGTVGYFIKGRRRSDRRYCGTFWRIEMGLDFMQKSDFRSKSPLENEGRFLESFQVENSTTAKRVAIWNSEGVTYIGPLMKAYDDLFLWYIYSENFIQMKSPNLPHSKMKIEYKLSRHSCEDIWLAYSKKKKSPHHLWWTVTQLESFI